MAESSRASRGRRRRSRRRRATAAGLGVIVVAGGGVAAFAATNSGRPDAQLATATLGSVTQTVESSGTITASNTSTPSFPVDGTVKSVAVKVGDSVTKGQVLATLDTTSLQSAVDAASSTLATAKQRLEADETGQITTDASGGGTTTGATTAAYTSSDSVAQVDSGSATVIETVADITPASTTGSSSLTALVKQIQSAQTAVVTAQQHIDSAQSAVDAAQKALDTDIQQNTQLSNAQQSACAPSSSTTGAPTATGSSSSTSSASTSDACTSAMADYEVSGTQLASDMATLDAKITTQDGDIGGLDTATSNLTALIGQLQSAAASTGAGSGGDGSGTGAGGSGGTTSSQPGNAGGSGQSSAPAGGSAAGGSGGQAGSVAGSSGQATGQPASAAQLAADQAAIDAAQAQLTLAQQNLAAATLTSPVTGKVGAIGFTVGTDSSGQTITILGTGTEQIDATVPLAEIDLVKPGQPVSIKADGTTTALRGTVSSLSLLSTTTGSSTTFPVVLTLAVNSTHLPVGTGADAVITTATATGVTVVPNSAIHTSATGQHTIILYKNGKPSTIAVTLGAVGNDTSQIKSGVTAGEQVELADLSQPLPSSTSSSSTTTGFAGFGGARGAAGAGARPGG